jgi:hypothetical protein
VNRFFLICVLAYVGMFDANAAFAHAVCGARVFPVPLTIDDPGVSDEASIPTFTYQRSGAEGGPGPTHQYDFEFEYDKRITTNLGLAVNYGWSIFRTEHAQTQTGFKNLSITAKYQTCVNPDHEFIFTLGLEREFGRTGTQHTGADEYGATTPTVYFGKGFGDLPVGFLRPFAITGQFSYSIADKGLKATPVPDRDTGLTSLQYNRGNSNQWFGGVAALYSVPYLQSQVKTWDCRHFWVGSRPSLKSLGHRRLPRRARRGQPGPQRPASFTRANGMRSASRR